MLTFSRFLNELFFAGVKTKYGYAEVYKNPNGTDLRSIGLRTTPPYHLQGKGWGDFCFNCGAILMPKECYAFDRETADHNEVLGLLKVNKFTDRYVPVYLNYFRESNILNVTLASYTVMPGMMSWTQDAMRFRAKTIPAFKKHFAKVVDDRGNPF